MTIGGLLVGVAGRRKRSGHYQRWETIRAWVTRIMQESIQMQSNRPLAMALTPMFVMLMIAIGAASSMFHWRSRLPLYALSVVLLLAITTSVIGYRQSEKKHRSS